jgi:hypothetical protein
MQLQKVYDLFQFLRDDHLCLYYQGEIQDAITAQLIALNDEAASKQEKGSVLKRKVAFVIAECFQNMIRHQEVPEIWNSTNYKPAMFALRQRMDTYHIASANLVKNEQVETLIWYLKELVRHDEEALRSLYCKLLPKEGLSEKGGAGLGLLELARKSNQQFAYDFRHINFFLSQFFFQLHLNAKGKSVPALSQFVAMYDSLLADNVQLVYKSDFTQDSMLPVLEMMESNLQWKNSTLTMRKSVLYVMVEMFQNIVKHAARLNDRQEGLLMICSAGKNAYNLITGNLVALEAIDTISDYLTRLNGLDEDALQQLYLTELRRTVSRDKGGAGLGLIETARYCQTDFEYSFFPYNQTHAFFALRVCV